MKELLAAFGIDFENCTLSEISTGLINTTWKVEAGDTWYVLQKVNQHVFRHPPAIAENTRMLADYLRIHHPDYLFVSPLPNLHGRTLVRDQDGDFFRLFPFVKETRTVDTVSTPDEAFEAARQFGRFTANLSGFDSTKLSDTIPDFHNLSLRCSRFEVSVAQNSAGRVGECSDEIQEVRRNYQIHDDYKRLILDGNVPKRVIHHDAKINNVLFDKDGRAICLIDLDTVMAGYFISDVGDMIRTYVSPAGEEERDLDKIEIRTDVFRAVAQGYLEEMGATMNEAETRLFVYAGYFMIYMQAIRFLADFLQGDTYYMIRYESHNLERARNQLRLLQRLQDEEAKLMEIVRKESS